MKPTIEQQLLGARPEAVHGRQQFVAQTMKRVRAISGHETFWRVLRSTSTTKKGRFMTKLTHLPKAAFGALAFVAIAGTAVAATNWFGTQSRLQTAGDTVKLSVQNCPVPFRAALKAAPSGKFSLNETYQIVTPAVITPHDIEQAQLARCEHLAIDATSWQRFPGSYFETKGKDGVRHKNGLYAAASDYGTISAISANTITITDVPLHYPEHDTRDAITLQLSDTVQVLDKGQAATPSSLRVGDQVYFVFQNGVSGADNLGDDWNPTTATILLLISKTQYDYRPIDKFYDAANHGAIKIMQSDNKFAG